MAKLYFRYGAMGSSKTANALMVQYNYQERGQNAVILKPRLDTRDGDRTVVSRSGLHASCMYIEDLDTLPLNGIDCIIVDEAQFLTREQVEYLADIVDDKNIPVICYGLRADFLGNLFEGSRVLMAMADTIEEIKTVCWCGRKATYNARIVNGKVAKAGEQILLGGNESYVALCRKHWKSGTLAPTEIRQISIDKKRLMPLLLEADPEEAMIDRYLDASEMFVLFSNGEAKAELCLYDRGDGSYEIKSLATAEEARGKGYAGQLIRHAVNICRPRTHTLYVGTSPDNVPFYKHFGFKEDYIEKDFFKQYAEPIMENGTLLTDMLYLRLEL